MKRNIARNDRMPIFTERFRELQGERSNTEFADFLGISRQTVGFYCNGDRIPDAYMLRCIAEKCNVSADWLLGLSDIRPTSYNEETPTSLGLTESFVRYLIFLRMNCFNGETEFFHSVLSSKHFFNAIKAIIKLWNIPCTDAGNLRGLEGCDFIHCAEEMGQNVLQKTDNKYTVCRVDTAVNGLIFKAQSSFASAIEDSYYNRANK